jgi:cell division protein FtsL
MTQLQRKIYRVFALLFLICFAINLLAFVRVEQSSADARQDTAKLQQWTASHEQLDNERYRKIEVLEATAASNMQRIARCEETQKALSLRLDDVVWWLRAVFGAIALQLIAAVFKFLFIRSDDGRRGR